MKPVKLECGTRVKGRWYGKEFEIVRHIGDGGTASVFLVKDLASGNEYAMKISGNMLNMDEEYRVLSRLKGFRYVTPVYYRDDCVLSGKEYFFLIVRYCSGSNLADICRNKPLSMRTALQIVMIAAGICKELNNMGIYYCDLKPDNLVFDHNCGCLYLIDFGGTAGRGEGVTHFTPYFDRASWGKGPRIADEQYQVFGLTMLLLVLAEGNEPSGKKHYAKLFDAIENSNLSKGLKHVIIKGLEQEYDSLSGYCDGLKNAEAALVYEQRRQDKRAGFLIDIIFTASIVFLIFAVKLLK